MDPHGTTKQSQPEPPAREATRAEAPAAQVETSLNLQAQSLGSRVGTSFSAGGDASAGTPALARSGLLHPAAGRERANFFRTLQSRHGNRFVQRAVRALEVDTAPAPAIQRECACGGTCSACREDEENPSSTIQRSGSDSGASGSTTVAGGVIPSGSSGSRLPAGTRRQMESGFGRDLGDVQVHTDSSAAQSAAALNANAYTYGRDIYFAEGKYAPDSKDGRRLLAHEIAHTIQQSQGAAPSAVALSTSDGVRVGRADDPLEAEADRAADSIVHSPAAGPARLSADRTRAIRGNILGDAWRGLKAGGRAVVHGGEYVGGKVVSGARAVVHGAEYVGGKVASAGRWVWDKAKGGATWVEDKAKAVGKWALGKLQHAWECMKATGHATVNLVTGNITSVADLLGIQEPAGQDQSTFDTLIMVLKHPCLQMIPGYELLAGMVKGLERAGHFLVGAWHIIQNPQPVIDKIQNTIGKMVAAIPAKAEALVKKALQSAGATVKKHGEGVWRHLEPKLAYLAKNWWDVIKQTGWTLLWPWPAVKKDAGEIWDHVKSGASNLWHLHPSDAMDDLLAVLKGVNSIAGSLYGWFLIASILVGAILGGIFGVGAGALPGAGAGLEFALSVGEGLVIATVALETADLAKAAFNLLALKQTRTERENDYERIASSGLTLAITGVMFLLGEIAVKFAEGLFSRVAGLFKAEPPEVPVEVPKLEAGGVKAPEVKGPKVEAPETKAPPSEVPETKAPPSEVPETKAPPSETPETKAPPSETPETKAPPSETPETVEPTPEPSGTEAPKASESEAAPEKGGAEKPPKEDPQAGVKKRIERLKQDAAEINENLERLNQEISDANRKINALKEKVEASTGEARTQASSELKAAREDLAELNGEYKAWTHDKVQNTKDQGRLVDALKEGTYSRPPFRSGVQDEVWNAAKAESTDGIVRDPLTEQEIKPGDPWQMGHKPGYEFWKHQQSAAERGISREQFIKECNDSSIYRPETPETNASHKLEAPEGVYYGK